MEKTEMLAQLLKRANSGEDKDKLKEEAKDFLSKIGPIELSMAEQKLIEEGTRPEELRVLCSAHMEMLDGEIKKFRKSLPKGHVVHTFVSEHDYILKFLDELDSLNEKFQKMESLKDGKKELKELLHVAEHLVGAEPHHKREEEVLFPAMEREGITGPPRVMRMEHEDLRAHKKELLELAKNAGRLGFKTFKGRLDSTAKFISFSLREHIFKENNILYPAAVKAIKGKEEWNAMKEECDSIGYCCFTPKGKAKEGKA